MFNFLSCLGFCLLEEAFNIWLLSNLTVACWLMRLVLQESASVTTDYVALGGMACTEVCASANFAAASMNMPFF